MAEILIVDDRPDEVTLTAQLNQESGVTAKAIHPEEVEADDLRAADLVLVDFQLEDSVWPQRDDGPVSRQPRDGLALASLLRRHVHDAESDSPTAFAILSSEIAKLAAPLPPDNRAHALARLNNLEWVFAKSKPGESDRLGEQVVELANAVSKLPAQWPKDDGHASREQLMNVLGMRGDCDGREQLLEDVTACIPPIDELSEWSHGLAIIRWLLHRILPYPCFLWGSHHLAARLRVDHCWLTEALESKPEFAQWLGDAQYEGMLSHFLRPRWWRTRVEHLLWEATDRNSFDVRSVYAAVSAKYGSDAKPSEPSDHPFVVVNSDFRPLDQFAAGTNCVRIRPDDWPAYADRAWTTIELAKSEASLGALVVSEDRGKLNGNG